MTLIKSIATAATLAFLSACGAPESIAVKPPSVKHTQHIGFASVEVKDVSLPSYAAADEIAQQAPDGSMITSKVLWADAPDRAIGLELSRNLSQLTQARVASEPWPFEEDAAATLVLRFVDLAAGTDGIYRATGQYFVGVYEGRERSGQFDLNVTYDLEGGPAAIANARGRLISDLSKFLARKALR